ncbi:hypothetical protein [Erwinia amylovora]|uniref:hypothetical protein n=1 Tax=Erwinia amylovora TaxID=552 RepID=UPI0020C1163D|nr:hypothetical protein [Erwinia amylovora]MCK8417625.1 hypothetical protein [Erwinia amylovora]
MNNVFNDKPLFFARADIRDFENLVPAEKEAMAHAAINNCSFKIMLADRPGDHDAQKTHSNQP